LSQCQEIIPTEDKFDFKNPLYSFDSTTVELCLSLFNWAKFVTITAIRVTFWVPF